MPQTLRRVGDHQENGRNGHHHRQIVEHVAAQLFMLPAHLAQVVGVDHLVCHPDLLVHPAHHHRLIDALVRPADIVPVQVHIQIVEVAHLGQGLIDKNIVHIERVLWQLQTAVPQHLGAVNDRVHQQILGGAEAADMLPLEHPVGGKHIAVVHHPAGVVLHMLVHVVADHHVHQLFVPDELAQLGQRLLQGGHV